MRLLAIRKRLLVVVLVQERLRVMRKEQRQGLLLLLDEGQRVVLSRKRLLRLHLQLLLQLLDSLLEKLLLLQLRCERLRMLLLLLITWRRGRRLLLSMLLLRIPRSGQRRWLRNLGRLRHLL